jgi:UDP-N-acetylmuramoyl-L-alanyl-D-glutamate--2,6-diaminopimelate ligase
MSAARSSHPAHQQIAAALAWLRQHVAPAAQLHADTRSLQAGDVFLGYAVDGADNRAFIADAVARGAAAVLYQPEGLAAAPAVPVAFAVPASTSSPAKSRAAGTAIRATLCSRSA